MFGDRITDGMKQEILKVEERGMPIRYFDESMAEHTPMDEIVSALGCIPVKDCSYTEWLGIGMALKDSGYECDVWDDWSKKKNDKRSVEGDCARRRATFKGSKRPVTVRTIRSMARKNGWVSAMYNFEDDQELAPADMLIRYLETLYQPEDLVDFATPSRNGRHGTAFRRIIDRARSASMSGMGSRCRHACAIDILSWKYLRYVEEHPIDVWDHPTSILYGGKDDLQSREVVVRFAGKFGCRLTVKETAGCLSKHQECFAGTARTIRLSETQSSCVWMILRKKVEQICSNSKKISHIKVDKRHPSC